MRWAGAGRDRGVRGAVLAETAYGEVKIVASVDRKR
jgi:hypothetical protein